VRDSILRLARDAPVIDCLLFCSSLLTAVMQGQPKSCSRTEDAHTGTDDASLLDTDARDMTVRLVEAADISTSSYPPNDNDIVRSQEAQAQTTGVPGLKPEEAVVNATSHATKRTVVAVDLIER
jgi:hypothetical protein